MPHQSWCYALSSVQGTSHTSASLPCQDACRCQTLFDKNGDEILIAVVADGAGSASHAEVGANHACELFLNEMTVLFGGGATDEAIDAAFIGKWFEHFRNDIERRAEAEGILPRDYACTFLASVIGPVHSAFIQVGDGAIICNAADGSDEYEIVFEPERGEYANVTYFITDPLVSEHLQLKIEGRVNEVALFTDGMERLAIRYQDMTAHTPFFRPVFAPLRSTEERGFSESLSAALGKFLNSKAVNERTDDDKTLVLATRRVIKETETGDVTGSI